MIRLVRNALFALFCAVCLVAVTWPGYLPANRITPAVFGLPLSLAWNVLWVALSFFALLGYHVTRPED